MPGAAPRARADDEPHGRIGPSDLGQHCRQRGEISKVVARPGRDAVPS
jgi:hypothetical protein